MPRPREVELLLLTAMSAVPLYFTYTVAVVPLIIFHAILAAMMVRVWRGGLPDIIPKGLLQALAILYVPFYFIDAAFVSRSAIAASTHLVLFIAVYQPIESVRKDNHAQRLLTASMIFVASVATSTHITIVLFVITFAFLMYRQLMDISHRDTEASLGRAYDAAPSSRAAAFYLSGTVVIGALLFPALPRVRNPLVQGITAALTNTATGLSDSIDFNRERTSNADPAVVARVWMGPEAIPFFTPLRLRGAVYDRYELSQWQQTKSDMRELPHGRNGFVRIARPIGFTRGALVQERFLRSSRFFFPVGTYSVRGVPRLFVGPNRDAYWTPFYSTRDVTTIEVSMARSVEPLTPQIPSVPAYPTSPAIAEMARNIVGNRTDAMARAEIIERYLSTRFKYLARPEQIGRVMSVDDFLLREHRGHCEYFAAGMVVLLGSLNVPARIVGGFYGGELNPLTGYFIIRREDAHAWVEVWDGRKWETFDPTPAAMRPGTEQSSILKMYASAIGDSITYFWDRYILTYGLGDQIALAAELIARTRDALARMRGATSRSLHAIPGPWLAAGLTGIVLLALLPVLIMTLRRRTLFDLFAAHLRANGIEVTSATTIEEALREVRARNPQLARDLEPLAAMYEAERFSPIQDRSRATLIRQRLAELRT